MKWCTFFCSSADAAPPSPFTSLSVETEPAPGVRVGRTDADDGVRDGAAMRDAAGAAFVADAVGFAAGAAFFAASVTAARGRGAAGASLSEPAVGLLAVDAASDARPAAAGAAGFAGAMDARRVGAAGATGFPDVDAASAGLLAAGAAAVFDGDAAAAFDGDAGLALVVFFSAAAAPAPALAGLDAGAAALVDLVTAGGATFTEPAPNVPELRIWHGASGTAVSAPRRSPRRPSRS
jgi:hypothetical protein